MHFVFAILAVLSLALTLWQWLVAWRFPLHRRVADKWFAPGVTLLKPLKGCDETTPDSLRSWFTQEYGGEVQILFGVNSADDPVCGMVRQLIQEHPAREAELVVCGEPTSANAKVSKLVQMERRAKHDIVIISDADVRVPAELLTNVVALFSANPVAADVSPLPPASREVRADSRPLLQFKGSSPEVSQRVVTSSLCPAAAESVAAKTGEGDVGLVNCFYRLANPATAAMRWEAVAINADFWSQVLQSRSLKPLDFALGAVMAVRREALQQIGGLAALTDYLADDYQLGNKVAQAGWRVELCPVVVECWSAPMSWGEVWRHQLRWARTIRVCQPLPYFFSILGNGTLWPLLWLLSEHRPLVVGIHTTAGSVPEVSQFVVPFSFIGSVVCLLVRTGTALDLQGRLMQAGMRIRDWWLVPVKDLMQAIIWLLAFVGRRIEWRGERYRLNSDGRLVKD